MVKVFSPGYEDRMSRRQCVSIQQRLKRVCGGTGKMAWSPRMIAMSSQGLEFEFQLTCNKPRVVPSSDLLVYTYIRMHAHIQIHRHRYTETHRHT